MVSDELSFSTILTQNINKRKIIDFERFYLVVTHIRARVMCVSQTTFFYNSNLPHTIQEKNIVKKKINNPEIPFNVSPRYYDLLIQH